MRALPLRNWHPNPNPNPSFAVGVRERDDLHKLLCLTEHKFIDFGSFAVGVRERDDLYKLLRRLTCA